MSLPGSVHADSRVAGVPSSNQIVFDVYMEGDKVGQDKIEFNYTGDTLIVERSVELDVSYVYINFLDYKHYSTGYWRDGRLVKLTGRTNQNGDKLRVRARRVDKKMVITDGENPASTGDTVVPTSWWNPAIKKGPVLLDTQFGRFREITVTRVGEESRRKGNKTVRADHYRISGDLELQLWYGPADELVGIQFERSGYTFTYERIL